MNKGKITAFLRKLGIMHLADVAKFYYQKWRNRAKNSKFKSTHPSIALPPDYLMFESFQLDYKKYYEDGLEVANWVADKLRSHKTLKNSHILDWGCGPARISRHLPQVINNGCHFYGTDYNVRTIEWCSKNIEGVNFNVNGINPPLNYDSEKFDALFGISIFTHLSEQNHYNWYNELMRVLRPGGIALLTTHGNAYMEIMTETEKEQFRNSKLVERANVKEGHRVFTAFQPVGFLQNLFTQKAIILEHKPGKKQSWGIDQDTWILQKK